MDDRLIEPLPRAAVAAPSTTSHVASVACERLAGGSDADYITAQRTELLTSASSTAASTAA
jgi:hypothetical protein